MSLADRRQAAAKDAMVIRRNLSSIALRSVAGRGFENLEIEDVETRQNPAGSESR